MTQFKVTDASSSAEHRILGFLFAAGMKESEGQLRIEPVESEKILKQPHASGFGPKEG